MRFFYLRPLDRNGRIILIAAGIALLLYGAFCDHVRADEYSITAGGSFGGARHILGGVTESNRATGILRLELDRKLLGVHAVFAVVPMEFQTHTPPDGTAWGFGVDPLGITGRVGALYVSGRGGVRWFNRAVPIPLGQRFNFTADAIVGIQIKRVSVGFDLHHVSNAGFGEKNPGANYVLLIARVAF